RPYSFLYALLHDSCMCCAYVPLIFLSFFSVRRPQYLHSFPTRRSSDLIVRSRYSSGLGPESPPRSSSSASFSASVKDAEEELRGDRKSTRLNSSHGSTSYAVFCL